jgi:hypothetical protein
MPNPSLRKIEIAGKYSDEAYEIARSVIAELEIDTSLPIREVMEITAAGTGTVDKEKNPRLHYKQLQGLARIGQLNNHSGSIANLQGAWGEAIALDDFRSFPGGVAIYEPVHQVATVEQRIGEFFIPGYQGGILKAFGNKTPDILGIHAQVEVPGGFLVPTLSSLVNPDNLSQTFSLPYPNKTLITAVEVTTSIKRSAINDKSKDLAGFINPFPNSTDKVFVPILYVDKDVFLKLQNKEEIVNRMRSVGGYVMLKKDLRENSLNFAVNTASIITNRVQSLSNQTSRSIDKSPKRNLALNAGITTQKKFQPDERVPSRAQPLTLLSSTNKLDAQKNLSNQPDHQLVVAKITAKASKFTALGLDVRNERKLNIAIAVTSNVGGWDAKKVLEQSPQYQNLSPDKKEAWLEGVVNEANKILTPKETSNQQNQIAKPQLER